MKRNFFLACLGILATIIATQSYAEMPPLKRDAVKTGVYGVCDAGNEGWQVRLTLNDNGTFSYDDRTDPAKPSEVTGTWKQKGNTVMLQHTGANVTVIEKWKVDKNRNCLKTRKKMLFVRLCNC